MAASNGEEKTVDRLANRRRTSELRRTCVEGEDGAMSTMEVFLPRVSDGRIAGQAMTKEQVRQWLALF